MNNRMIKKIIIIFTIIVVVAIIIMLLLIMILKSKSSNNDNTDNISHEGRYIVDANNKKRPEKKESELVEENEYNTFSIQATTEEGLLSKYLEDYQYNAINHIEDAYSSLDKEYREKKFNNNIENYKNYLNNRQEMMHNMKLSKYQINKYDTYDQYICLDQYENYYVFNKMPDMSYSVILDTYTVNLPQFTEEYNKANDGRKVGLNIEKFIGAINQQDYKYAYEVLDSTFKENNMPNINDFENFVKNNFYFKNDIEYLDANRDGDNIIYKTKIKDKISTSQEGKNLTIVMKLLDNTEFAMAFSFD